MGVGVGGGVGVGVGEGDEGGVGAGGGGIDATGGSGSSKGASSAVLQLISELASAIGSNNKLQKSSSAIAPPIQPTGVVVRHAIPVKIKDTSTPHKVFVPISTMLQASSSPNCCELILSPLRTRKNKFSCC